MSRVRGGRGYLLIDNRASGGEKLEMATLTCSHCNTIVVLNKERSRSRSYCRSCNAYICDSPGCNAICASIEKSLEILQTNPGLPLLARGKQGELLCDPNIFNKNTF